MTFSWTDLLLLFLFAIVKASWIGDEYWVFVDGDGRLPDDVRIDGDLVRFEAMRNGQTDRNAYVAFWIKRNCHSCPRTHYEVFGHAYTDDEGILFGRFIGPNGEAVIRQGGFRVLTRSRNTGDNPFVFVKAGNVGNREAVSYLDVSVSMIISRRRDEAFFGSVKLRERRAIGVNQNHQCVEVNSYDERYDYENLVYVLTKTTPDELPPPSHSDCENGGPCFSLIPLPHSCNGEDCPPMARRQSYSRPPCTPNRDQPCNRPSPCCCCSKRRCETVQPCSAKCETPCRTRWSLPSRHDCREILKCSPRRRCTRSVRCGQPTQFTHPKIARNCVEKDESEQYTTTARPDASLFTSRRCSTGPEELREMVNGCKYSTVNCRERAVETPKPIACARGKRSFGDDFWVEVDYNGQLQSDRAKTDLMLFNASHRRITDENAYVALWTVYENETEENDCTQRGAFGQAYFNDNHQLIGRFVDENLRPVILLGGFRVLARSRLTNRNLFKFVNANEMTDSEQNEQLEFPARIQSWLKNEAWFGSVDIANRQARGVDYWGHVVEIDGNSDSRFYDNFVQILVKENNMEPLKDAAETTEQKKASGTSNWHRDDSNYLQIAIRSPETENTDRQISEELKSDSIEAP